MMEMNVEKKMKKEKLLSEKQIRRLRTLLF
jgi:hypothetical protein